MSYTCDQLIPHIHWALSKPPIPGWKDIRQNTFGHTLYWIHDGVGIFSTDSSDFRVESGTLLYLHPGMELFMESDEHVPLRMTMLLFECAQYQISADGNWEVLQVDQLELPFVQRFSSHKTKELGKIFLEAEMCWVPGNAAKETKAKALLLELLADFHGDALKESRVSGEEGNVREALIKVKDYIEQYYHTNLQVGDLGKRFMISEAYLRKSFSEAFGCSPKAYLTRIRTQHAMRYLSYTDDSVSNIAKVCGYADVYHFSKAFKKSCGMSPLDYRKCGMEDAGRS
ncbi:AraC family transcriptional regulator [Paenibacillus hexagrammi]|uniref:AraC family transcriptional regulator n=1 Tax=Paenibacillus hexagrammi TaxID=2908839 RepID=A0ABY3SL27_9BACL|nr:AraC family transcriptional regulator [Paenibacillus sp. YPD9-1]UJF34414.1 AraC family transcriptional regulator [Paenibacillus sp. YPD9-1]